MLLRNNTFLDHMTINVNITSLRRICNRMITQVRTVIHMSTTIGLLHCNDVRVILQRINERNDSRIIRTHNDLGICTTFMTGSTHLRIRRVVNLQLLMLKVITLRLRFRNLRPIAQIVLVKSDRQDRVRYGRTLNEDTLTARNGRLRSALLDIINEILQATFTLHGPCKQPLLTSSMIRMQ